MTLNAATMLGQSKTAHQAEIDAACELIDFWRFNPTFMTRIYEEQPVSSPGQWNRMEYRPLEGFVFAVTPFNFTAIGGNLPTSAALMGNTVLWKPASTAALLRPLPHADPARGRPAGRSDQPGVRARRASSATPRLASPDLAGIHFTGSTGVFQSMWRTVGQQHRALPQLPAHRRRDRRQGLHPRPPTQPTSTRSRRRSSAAPSSIRARSARRLRACSSPRLSGRISRSASSKRSARSRWATSATSGTSWAP